MNYCGFLCNPENGFIMKAFLFCAALNVDVSRVLYQAHTYMARAALLLCIL